MLLDVLVAPSTIYLACQKYVHKIFYPTGTQNFGEILIVITKKYLGSPSKRDTVKENLDQSLQHLKT